MAHNNKKKYVLVKVIHNRDYICHTSDDNKINSYIIRNKTTRSELIKVLTINYFYNCILKSVPVIDPILGNLVSVTKADLDNFDSFVQTIDLDWNWKTYEWESKYILYKELGADKIPVDISKFEKEIIEALAKEQAEYNRSNSEEYFAYKRRLRKYTFRKGAVPGVHKRKWNYRNWYRVPKIRSAYAQQTAPDLKSYTRRGSLPDHNIMWDEYARHKDHSWKTSCKVRKQWMKHIDKHGDTCELNKFTYLNELDDLIQQEAV